MANVPLLADNAYATLGGGLLTTDTTLNFTAGQGARFPTINAPNVLYCCILNSSNILEEVIMTAHAAGADTATITRAQGGTTAKAWNTGDRIEARLSSSALLAYIQTSTAAFAPITSTATLALSANAASTATTALAASTATVALAASTATVVLTFPTPANVAAGTFAIFAPLQIDVAVAQTANPSRSANTPATNSYIEYFNLRINQTGTYRCSASSPGNCSTRIFQNGTAIGTVHTGGGTDDIACTAGDTLQLFANSNGFASSCSFSWLGIAGTSIVSPPTHLPVGYR